MTSFTYGKKLSGYSASTVLLAFQAGEDSAGAQNAAALSDSQEAGPTRRLGGHRLRPGSHDVERGRVLQVLLTVHCSAARITAAWYLSGSSGGS
jgi:hypothetical protein